MIGGYIDSEKMVAEISLLINSGTPQYTTIEGRHFYININDMLYYDSFLKLLSYSGCDNRVSELIDEQTINRIIDMFKEKFDVEISEFR